MKSLHRNKALIEQAEEKIFNKINQFNKLNGDLDMTMKSQRDQLKDNLDEYEHTVYLSYKILKNMAQLLLMHK